MAWDAGDPEEVRSTPIRAVRDAMLTAYPFLRDVEALVPPSLYEGVPASERPKAAGQYVTSVEAAAVAGAVAYCVARGVPVLPVHDALLVPVSKAGVAREALEGAFVVVAGVLPVLKDASLPATMAA